MSRVSQVSLTPELHAAVCCGERAACREIYDTVAGPVLAIEIDTCARYRERLRVIASIEEPQVIARILAHLERAVADQQQAELPLGVWAPPTQARLM
ncbi:MAG: hypothetical protein H7A16_01880 [Sinobacteraceae bacterium]|nr:hypothetical protein [Nevskiaceae bacterium]